jgi:rhodanese-related sulfurtransferase
MKAEELEKRISRGDKIKLIDVREADEYASGEKIEGSENIPMGKMFAQASHGDLARGAPMVVFCRTGGRCEVVARELRSKGYDIDHLEGGIEEWNRRHEDKGIDMNK